MCVCNLEVRKRGDDPGRGTPLDPSLACFHVQSSPKKRLSLKITYMAFKDEEIYFKSYFMRPSPPLQML